MVTLDLLPSDVLGSIAEFVIGNFLDLAGRRGQGGRTLVGEEEAHHQNDDMEQFLASTTTGTTTTIADFVNITVTSSWPYDDTSGRTPFCIQLILLSLISSKWRDAIANQDSLWDGLCEWVLGCGAVGCGISATCGVLGAVSDSNSSSSSVGLLQGGGSTESGASFPFPGGQNVTSHRRSSAVGSGASGVRALRRLEMLKGEVYILNARNQVVMDVLGLSPESIFQRGADRTKGSARLLTVRVPPNSEVYSQYFNECMVALITSNNSGADLEETSSRRMSGFLSLNLSGATLSGKYTMSTGHPKQQTAKEKAASSTQPQQHIETHASSSTSTSIQKDRLPHISGIGTSFQSLVALDVSNCQKSSGVNDAFITATAKSCHHLQSLDVSRTGGFVTDIGIAAVAKHCGKTLRRLCVRSTSNKITDKSMMLIAKSCRQLQALDIGNTNGKISEATLVQIVTNSGAHFEALGASNCDVATDTLLTALGKCCPKLRILLLGSNSSPSTKTVTDDGLIKLAQCLQEYQQQGGSTCKLSHLSLRGLDL